MNCDQFDKILTNRLELTRTVLASKREEYAGEQRDRLHNFNRAAAMLGVTREAALVGMWAKHIISILDIVDDLKIGKKPTLAIINEKIGDSMNYSALLEAMLIEDIGALDGKV
jgi:hypothetical protein